MQSGFFSFHILIIFQIAVKLLLIPIAYSSIATFILWKIKNAKLDHRLEEIVEENNFYLGDGEICRFPQASMVGNGNSTF